MRKAEGRRAAPRDKVGNPGAIARLMGMPTRATMRVMTAAVLLSVLAGGARAQTPAPTTGAPPKPTGPATNGAAVMPDMPNAAAIPEAPIGHRQPTQRSLPPRVREDEASPRAVDPLGPLPQICNGC
jgi:hypothetical protein